MSLDQRIKSWLRQIEPLTKSQHDKHKHCAKRRRLNPPTPDPSQSSRSMGSRRSKRRAIDALDVNNDNDDILDTPRPPKLQAPRSESGTSLTSSSAASGYSSPTKQLRELKFHPRGVDSRELKDFQNKPASLKTLLQKIDDSVSGFGILPTSQRTCMSELDVKVYDNFEWVKAKPPRDIFFSDDRDDLGHTPPPEVIQTILHQAGECSERGHSEASWNVEVHHLVLKAALRPLQGPQSSQFFDFLLSTTASILPDYQATSASKKVDFCMYIDPKHDESAQIRETILTLMNVLPMGMFNHTNLLPLSDRPIAVSIETKKTGEGWDNARLQMEVWMAAHWQFLRKVLQLHRLAAGAVSSLEQTDGFNSYETRKLPEFLPGIIIQGHDWYLIITTSEGEKTIFWHKENFGQTSKSKGIYTIIHNLQLLRKWAQEVYWEWMRELLLSWPRHRGKVFAVADY
ncbi:hypothetical protein Forpi1262_v018791 [Fusarium oxysporum f. sp. raphani]|nr:hypothetical protein Forpi1262_v018791 [Fusarium oxysporum f. sp. raphani]KAH7204902.1 hypothetical protein BKA60DRAFT_611851 [Fusarium oxysporum]